MEQKQDYTWRELIGQAERIQAWHPFVVPDPYRTPGFNPRAETVYGQGRAPGSYAWHNPENPERSLDQINLDMCIGEAALWQLHSESGYTNVFERRLRATAGLLKFMPHDFEHTSAYNVRILPFRESVGPDGMVPFTIYERKGRRDDVIAVQIDRKVHYSTDERLIQRKREAFWGIKARAADWAVTHQIIAEAIKAQGRELGYDI